MNTFNKEEDKFGKAEEMSQEFINEYMDNNPKDYLSLVVVKEKLIQRGMYFEF